MTFNPEEKAKELVEQWGLQDRGPNLQADTATALRDAFNEGVEKSAELILKRGKTYHHAYEMVQLLKLPEVP